MRISRIEARAFGPLEGRTLELAPGLSVIGGANESGKSSWYHAIALGLCGIRRGRGKTKAERELEARFRPWTGDAWAVSIHLALDGGDTLEIQRDFAGKTPTAVIDGLGRDRAAELMVEGAPDGSVLLGLDRRAAPAVMLVGQAEILAVRDRAGALQDALQRAAVAGGGDAITAEAAIATLDAYRRDRIGTEKQGAARPLRRAVDELREAEGALARARQAQAEHATLCAERDRLEALAEAAEAEVAAARAREARKRLGELERRCHEAETLVAEIDGEETDAVDETGSLEARVADALSAHRACPAEPDPPAAPAPHDIERALTELPPSVPEAGTRAGRAAVATAIAGLALAAAGVGATMATERDAFGLALALAGALMLALSLAARSWMTATRAARHARRSAAASRKQELEAWLAASRLERARHDEIVAARKRTLEELRAVAREVGIGDLGDVDALAESLAAWQTEARERRRRHRSAREREARLAALLGGSSLAELAAQVADQRREVRRLEEAAGGAAGEHRSLGALEERAAALRGEADAARGAAMGAAAQPTRVADAEERAERARAVRDRLRTLDEVLRVTRDVLVDARDATHRDLAPALASAVGAHLPRITGGRYREVRVDPMDLAVRVRDSSGSFREAHRLSHGTAEQIYLLLRAALADHLVTTGERAPLILDDVTVHCDAERKRALLELLLELAARRQIIVFSQEREVLGWARASLHAPRDRLIELDPPRATDRGDGETSTRWR